MLQGSIEDFTLDEVLGLVSTTAKTGELRVEGDRGEGQLWLVDGQLTKAACAALGEGAEPVDVVFELLRFRTGSFVFTSGVALPGDERIDIDTVLEAALDRVGEWEGIAEIVPSLDHMVSPVVELDADEVTLDRDDWATLIAIGERRRIATVLERLGLDEIAGSRRLKDLVERSLVEIGSPELDTPAPTPSPAFSLDSGAAPVIEPVAEAELTPEVELAPVTPIAPVEPAAVDTPVSPFGAPTPVEIPAALAGTPTSFEPTPEAISEEAAAEVEAVADAEPPSPAEIAEFGSKLSEPFDPASLVVSDTEENSLLMRYLKSDS